MVVTGHTGWTDDLDFAFAHREKVCGVWFKQKPHDPDVSYDAYDESGGTEEKARTVRLQKQNRRLRVMKKTLNDLKPAMMRVLERRYGKEQAVDRWAQMEKQYAQWLQEEGDLGGKSNMMSSNMTLCYAVCALYEALERNFTKAEFDAFLNDAMGKVFAMLNRLDMNKLEKKRWLIRLVYWYMEHYQKQAEQKRGGAWGNTWKVRINPDGHKRGVAYVLDTCPLYEFVQKHGYMDILPYMCASDQLVARQFHAHLIRHHILSDGDGCCEYWFVGDKSPEAMEGTGAK